MSSSASVRVSTNGKFISLTSQIAPPPGWSKDRDELGLDDYWAADGTGQFMAKIHGLGQATPIMCRTGGDVLFLIRGGAFFYFWNPIDGIMWRITGHDNEQDIVEELKRPKGMVEMQKEMVDQIASS